MFNTQDFNLRNFLMKLIKEGVKRKVKKKEIVSNQYKKNLSKDKKAYHLLVADKW